MAIFIGSIVFTLLQKETNKKTNKQASQLELHKKEKCENQYFCNIAMPSEDSKILELINTKNLTKHQFYLHNCLIEKIDGYKIILKVHSK